MKSLFASMLMVGVMLPGVAFPAQTTNKKPSATMYKCQDEKGRTYYADKPSPECAGGVQELSRQGVRINRAGHGQPDASAGVRHTQRSRRDKALLATYSTEQQIEAAKQRNLELPLQAVKQLETKLERARKELQGLQAQAESYASQKKQIPAALLDDVKAKQAQVARLEAELARKQAHATQIAQRFDADKQRFRELHAQAAH